MKKIRIGVFMSGVTFAAMGQLPYASGEASTAVPFGPGVRPYAYQQTVQLAPVAPALIQALKGSPENNRRLQIGLGRGLQQPIVVNRSTVPLSQWTVLANGWSIWSAEVASQGALGLRLHLESLRLPAGARFVLYDSANPLSQPVQLTDIVSGRREVWSPTLFSERAVVECQCPPGADLNTVSFVISGVSHLYSLPLSSGGPAPKEGTCHNDVTCYPNYAQQASGVARISFVDGGNTFVCTGCRLAGNDSSQPYFLTANHCVYDQTIASTVEAFWFYQTSSCNGTPPSLSSVPRTTGGGDLLATANGNDFSFMRLRQAPPSGAAALSWSTSAPGGDGLACIHHPGGAYKRISFGQAIGATANFWGVQWSSGVTEPGSSGSPLLNGNHEVIGQLNAGFNGGGGSSCTDPTAPDQFGRFDLTYPAIQQWLSGKSAPPGFTFVNGTYTGLFFDQDNGPALNSAGSFSVATTTKGNYSARLQVGASRYSFSGKFDYTGAAQFSIPRGGLNGQLQIDPNDIDHITGTLTDGNFTSELDGDRAVFTTRNPSDQAGPYTMVIPDANDSSTPGGDSFGTVTVDRAGHIRLAASLADGVKFSQSATMSKNGRWPLYTPLYSGHGFLLSWVSFGDNGSSDFSGQAAWERPAWPTAKLYPGGFTFQANILGSRYTRPPSGGQILDLTDAAVYFGNGNLLHTFADPITIGPNSKVKNLGPDRLTLSFSAGNGLFHGAVVPPGTTRTRSFNGVVFQKQQTANGYFLGDDQSGYAFVGPRQ